MRTTIERGRRQSSHVNRYERRRERASRCLPLGDCSPVLSHGLSANARNDMTFGEFSRARIFLLVEIFFVLALPRTNGEAWIPEDCPSFCVCYPLYGLRWAECVGRRLYSIHTGVDGAVQALDLSNNSVGALADYELRDASLTRLKLLNLSSNAISEIGLRAFAGLSDLRVLDLSRNHLYSLLTDTFVDNKKLEVLELAGNNLNQHVPRLRSSSIASLGLGGCRISHLPPDTFDDLPRLRVLDLTDNMMIQIDFDILKTVPNLGVLMLDRNPWSCNNKMYELQDRLTSESVIFRKVCIRKTPRIPKGPKKFEKMIALEDETTTASNDVGGSGRLLAKIKNWRKSWKAETAPERCPTSVVTTNKSEKSFDTDLSTISPYWFFAVGLLLGSALGTVATYLWLTKTITRTIGDSRRRAIRRPESLEIADQRANLLDHLWRNSVDAGRPTTECPGTPPPPYRDVMQHASRYPRPHIQAIFANDPVARDERQVRS